MLQNIRESRYLSPAFLIPLSAILILAFLLWVAFRLFVTSAAWGQDPNSLENGHALAQRIATVSLTEEQVIQANGMYAPGRGIFVYTLLDTDENLGLSNWVRQRLSPFYTTIDEQIPPEEEIYWYIVNVKTKTQAVVIVPAQRVDDLAYYGLAQAPNGSLADLALNTEPLADNEPLAINEPLATAEPVALEESAVATTTPIPPEPTGEPEITTLYIDDFTAGIDNWFLLAGDWQQGDGTYQQENTDNFDQISVFNIEPITGYTATISFYLREATMGPGFVYRLSETDNRVGAYIVDFDRSNSILRFGQYEDNGAYQSIKTIPLDAPLELETWYTLHLVVDEAETVVFLDDAEIGRQPLDNSSGYLGLVTSLAAVDFDDFELILAEAE